jgi:hypothetical protein
VTSARFSEIDLAAMYPQNRHVVLYAYARIESPDDRDVRATFGSNDGIKVICNGEVVFEKHLKRNLMPDEDSCMLPLRAGRNDLLLKIDQGAGGWGFSFRLPENTVRNHDYKYQILLK